MRRGISVDGELASGELTNAEILPIDPVASPTCGVTINNIASLQAAASAGRIYVNVHSEAFPAGVVRGQLFDLFNEHLIELIEGHSHIYLTGRGKGHNNTDAETSPALLP